MNSVEELFAHEDVELHTDDGRRLFVVYEDLVDHIEDKFQEQFEQVPEKHRELVWYTRVRRWCQKNKIGLRKTNRVTQTNPAKIAVGVRNCRQQVNAVVKEKKLKRSQIANLDETALRVFSLMVKTLHWKGAKSIQADKHSTSKLTLSMPTIWFADGSMDFVVVYASTRKADNEADRWSEHNGVLFYRAASKWTTKKIYYKVLRALIPFPRKVGLFLDDIKLHGID